LQLFRSSWPEDESRATCPDVVALWNNHSHEI